MAAHILIDRCIHPHFLQLAAELARLLNQLVGKSLKLDPALVFQNRRDLSCLGKDAIFNSTQIVPRLVRYPHSLSFLLMAGSQLLELLVGQSLADFAGSVLSLYHHILQQQSLTIVINNQHDFCHAAIKQTHAYNLAYYCPIKTGATPTIYNQLKMKIKSVVVIFYFLAVVLSSTCSLPSTTIGSTDLSNIFDKTISLVNYKPQLIDLINSPSIDNVKNYLMTQAPYVIPLWSLAGLTFVMLIACCLQICCYNCCGMKSCGTPISVKSYKPSILSCCVYSFMIFSVLLIAAGIAAYIVSADLVKETNYSICNFNSTLTELFQGSAAGDTVWSGVDNFNTFGNQIATNFPNTVPTLNAIFNSAAYNTVVNNGNSSSFAKAMAYSCPSSLANSTVSCPFSNLTQCTNGSNIQTPIFSQQFCNTNFTNSASQLVQQQIAQNSTLWQSSLVNLSAIITNFSQNPIDFSQLKSQSSQIQSSITTYQPQLQSGIQLAYNNMHTSQMGIYGVTGFFLFMGLISFLSICCVYCTRNFRCRYLLYILWLFFAILAIAFFVISGILLMGTFVAYDGCSAYRQLTTNQSTFESFRQQYYNGSDAMKILSTCFYSANKSTSSIFDAFASGQQPDFRQLQHFISLYASANPAPTFSSVSSNITDQLFNYAANPNTVTLAGANSAQNPQAALDAANVFASDGGSSSCKAVKDKFVYNPDYCYPLSLNQAAGTPSCIVISSSSSQVVSGRQTSFTSPNCNNTSFSTYQNNFNALNVFGGDISTLTTNYMQDAGLNTYTASYFNYYTLVRNFMNNYTQSLFLSFLLPYQSLIQGSSCSYLTSTLNNLVANTCNNNFPYIYALSALIILISCSFFFLMILAYFLTVRMEFYQFLDGDLSNYEEGAGQKPSEIQMADLSTTNREKLLPAPSMQFSEPLSPTRYAPNPPAYSQPPAYNYPPYQGSYAQYPPPPPVQRPSSPKKK